VVRIEGDDAMKLTRLRVLFGIVFACQAFVSQAGIIALEPVNSGEVSYMRQQFLFPPYPTTQSYNHDAPLTELALQQFSSAGCLCSVLYLVNGYVIYDVASVGFPVGGASLELDFTLETYGDLGFLAINTIDDFTPEELSALPPAGLGLPLALGEALTSDIASGVLLGTLHLTAGSGLYTVALDSAAVDLINETGGLLAFGLYYSKSSSDDSLTQLNFTRGPRLILSERTHDMPEPGTWTLLLAAAALLMAQKRHLVKHDG
jgi:hypothetical protein